MSIFFYDSYAIIEYINENSSFEKYFEEHTGIFTLLNLLEVYYTVLKEVGKEKAEIVLQMLYPLIVEPSKETIRNAMLFRLDHKKKDLSYSDCIGYHIALERGIRFLTGDQQFQNFENVEFVK